MPLNKAVCMGTRAFVDYAGIILSNIEMFWHLRIMIAL